MAPNTIQLARQHERLLSNIRLRLLGPESGSMADRRAVARSLKEVLDSDTQRRKT